MLASTISFVISSIFEKDFYVQIATPQGAERIQSYLQALSLPERVVTEIDDIKEDSLSVDFENRRNVVSCLKKKSKEYLATALT